MKTTRLTIDHAWDEIATTQSMGGEVLLGLEKVCLGKLWEFGSPLFDVGLKRQVVRERRCEKLQGSQRVQCVDCHAESWESCPIQGVKAGCQLHACWQENRKAAVPKEGATKEGN